MKQIERSATVTNVSNIWIELIAKLALYVLGITLFSKAGYNIMTFFVSCEY